MKSNIKILLIYCMATAVIAFHSEARADNTNENAKKAFIAGTKLFEQGKFAEAARSFQKAYDLRPAWKILLNIGECSAAAKEYGVALEAFQSYLTQGGDEVPLDKRDSVVGEIRVLRELVGQLIAEAPDNAELFIDGIKRGRFPLPGPVLISAGVNHDVKIFKDGDVLIQKTIRVNSGNSMELSTLKPAPTKGGKTVSSAPEEPKNDNDTLGSVKDSNNERDEERTDDDIETNRKKKKLYSKPLRVAAWSTTGVGLSLLVGGVVTGVLAFTNNDDLLNDNCGSKGCDALSKKVKNLQITTNVLLGEGGGVTVVGAALLIVSYVQQKKRSGATVLLPMIDSQNLGLTLTYEF